MEFTLAIAQINAHVGALEKNRLAMVSAAKHARRMGAKLVLFPELALTGYPPEDLLHKPSFLRRVEQEELELRDALREIGVDAIYGVPRRNAAGTLWNAAALIEQGIESQLCIKQALPNYGVFDERRYFEPGGETHSFNYQEIPMGINICEDIWQAKGAAAQLARQGAKLIINLNASPYRVGKWQDREEIIRARVQETGLPVIYVNLVGGQDELVFDGGSFAMDHTGKLVERCRFFSEELRLMRVKWDGQNPVVWVPVHGIDNGPVRLVAPMEGGDWRAPRAHGEDVEPPMEPLHEIYTAMKIGLHDYVRKNGFQGVVLGLSGGVDSALTAAVAVDALGADKVESVMMPSAFTSGESLSDAELCAANLGIKLGNLTIGPLFELFKQTLAEEFAGLPEDVTEENLQPRIRGTLLMALSNKKGTLLLTTGNKSEMSVGYATLYGDMAGGYSVLKDLLKTTVFELCEWRNEQARKEGKPLPIPQNIIDKPPTAELRHDQKDTDSLPPYDILDTILHHYVELEEGLDEIVAAGIERAEAVRVIAMVDRNEYKRRQAPPGVRIVDRNFGKARRYPLTNGFKVR
ncbi:NAD+ synthetase [Magnetococcus marinus MC-1]|uniref:Glutamine-dependent NAD(+) synthetase n=1 Tax=Magnetococcus marinus (strain ATCC BAA-1437 / JCM 17883 / MC-1) TaxID=156889 RepID=A0LDN5_MAGMM|nr:NAD+ synthase [Magnetococcus marinus]ABK46078.1 NAD+ synthetase [Magnetococcus marinus MC-1]